jgi:hypothetical protein
LPKARDCAEGCRRASIGTAARGVLL